MTKTPKQTTKLPDSIDALLDQVAQGTEFHFQSGLCGDWTIAMNHPPKAGLHIVTQGTCWFGFPDSASDPKQLHAGDVIFVNQGISHFLSRSAIANPVPIEHLQDYCQPEHQEHGILCYDINSLSATTDTIFRLLPPWVLINAPKQAENLQALIKMVRDETQHAGPGSEVLVQRLSDVIAIHLLRAVINENTDLHGPLAALHDRHLRPLVLAIIEQPGADWSVEVMAQHAFLSTSAFAERCIKQTGLAPKKLVDQLRLQRARSLLKNSDLPLDLVAEQLGYQSATAFNRFFKKYAGTTASNFRNTN